MKFRELRKKLKWLVLETRGFYEGINFENIKAEKRFKRLVAEWMFYLKEYKKLRVRSFKDLFREQQELKFPITIEECWGTFSLWITIVDNKGTEYYMEKTNIFCYDGLEDYRIGKRERIIPDISFVERDFHYKISKDGIILTETEKWKSNNYDANPDTKVKFCFDSDDTTEAIISNPFTSNEKIKIRYQTINTEFDEKVEKYLLDINEKYWYYYDVFPALEWMLSVIAIKNVSLSIAAEVDGNTYSEVVIDNGIVQKYTKTERISEGWHRTSIDVFAKSLEDFLAERN